MDDPQVHGSGTTFFELPQELIWEMLYHLPPKDVVHFCLTHRSAANIICKNNDFWFEKIMRDFGDVYEIKREDIPVKNRLETYKSYWEDAPSQLLLCAERGATKCVESLLRIGVDPNIQNKQGTAPLIAASREGLVDMVRLLLEYGAKPNIQNICGYTALLFASSKGYPDIVRMLLEHDADPDIPHKRGGTALMDASWEGNTAAVRLLLEHSANPDIRDAGGETALMLAFEGRYTDIVRLLEHFPKITGKTNGRLRGQWKFC